MRVSIIVISYNSEKTILETLNSICEQTYRNFEVIIADDGSIDNTAEICRLWRNREGKNIDIKFLFSEQNRGTIKNLNDAVKISKGDFIQIIAGDDILYPSCIEKRLKYCLENEVLTVFSEVELFGNNKRVLHDYERNAAIAYNLFRRSREEQLDAMLNGNWVLGPMGGFYSKKLYDLVGGYDERLRLIEDSPFIFTILLKYGKLPFLSDKLVKYRISSGSVSVNRNSIFYLDSIKISLFYKFPIFLKNRQFDKMKKEIIWCVSEML